MSDGVTARDVMADDALRASVYAHAAAWAPKECCGLLVSGPGGVEAVLCDNLADKYHQLDPEMYPRTGERAYILNPLEIAKLEDAGKRLVAIFHSHVEVGAYFSDEDVAQAMSPFDDGPRYPGVDYVVLDYRGGSVEGFEVFTWHDGDRAFVTK